MSDDERLVHSSQNPFARQLLEAGLREGPSAASVRSIARGVGLGATAGLIAGAAAPATAAPAAAASAHAGLAAAVLKWLAAGAVVGSAVSVGGFVAGGAGKDPSASAPSARAGVTAPSDRGVLIQGSARGRGEPPALSVPARPATTPRASLPSASVSARRPPPAPRSGAISTTPPHVNAVGGADDGALAREAAWIDAARSALESGQLASAHAALDDYDASRRVGVLNREALVLRIEVLLRQGDSRRASALTERFAASYPGDPHVARLRAQAADLARGIDPALPRH